MSGKDRRSVTNRVSGILSGRGSALKRRAATLGIALFLVCNAIISPIAAYDPMGTSVRAPGLSDLKLQMPEINDLKVPDMSSLKLQMPKINDLKVPDIDYIKMQFQDPTADIQRNMDIRVTNSLIGTAFSPVLRGLNQGLMEENPLAGSLVFGGRTSLTGFNLFQDTENYVRDSMKVLNPPSPFAVTTQVKDPFGGITTNVLESVKYTLSSGPTGSNYQIQNLLTGKDFTVDIPMPKISIPVNPASPLSGWSSSSWSGTGFSSPGYSTPRITSYSTGFSSPGFSRF
jgi:hypothetical protein